VNAVIAAVTSPDVLGWLVVTALFLVAALGLVVAAAGSRP
jgi:hypothetical protein